MTLINSRTNTNSPRSYFPEDVTLIPPTSTLPDPFRFFDPGLGTDGRVVTRADWEQRRQEIKDLSQYYYFGYKQPLPQSASRLVKRDVNVPETVIIDRQRVMETGSFNVRLPDGSFKWEFADFSLRPVLDFNDDNWGSWDSHRDLLITIPAHVRTDTYVVINYNGKAAEIKLDALEVPACGADTDILGPYPAVIVIGGLSSEQIRTLKLSGYAYISLNTGSVYSDNKAHTGAYTELFPYTVGVYEYDSGALMGWAWGVSRIIDALLNDPDYNIDGTRTAVTGVSRNGKAALIAAAFDERVGIAVPCDPGAAGLTNFRFLNEGKLYGYNTYGEHCQVNRVFSRNEKPVNTIGSDGHWLSSKAQDFIPDKTPHFPFDMHEVAALVAPRPFIAFTGENFEWVNSVSTAVTMAAVREVYDFLGAGEDIALIVRDAAHANQDRDLPFIIAVMDRVFGRSGGLTVKQFKSLMKPDSIEAIDGSGVIYPEKEYGTIAEMSAVPYELESSYQRWSRPGKYMLWCETELVTENYPFDIFACSDAPEIRLTFPSGSFLTQKVNNGCAVFRLSSGQVVKGRYKLETAGTEKDGRAVYFQGFALSDALRHGLNLVSTSPDGMSVGFSGKLIDKEGIKAFICSGAETRQLETGLIDGLTPVYLEAYGVSLKKEAIPEGSFVLNLKNIRLETLPGCIFELYIELTGIRQPNMYAGGKLEGRAVSTQGERPTWNSSYLKCGPMPEWPVYPAGIHDTGERPDFVPTVSGFSAEISLNQYNSTLAELSFSSPVNKNEFGLGFEGISDWILSWAEDVKSVRISYNEAQQDLKLYIFRLADLSGNMLPEPKVFPLHITK